jgi:16S rRNA (cytosine1402-N4)-methyltransferase
VALSVARERLSGVDVTFIQDDFKSVLPSLHGIDGVLMDLGISSYQVDTAERGFSYRLDGALDMRMNPTVGLSAADVVNTFDERQIADIIYKYGEDRFAQRIARFIVEARQKAPITTTLQLAETVEAAIPAKYRYTGGNPCKRTFQAIRIYVNDELNGLYECILAGIDNLNKGGRIAVITFHSLEDRIVKNAFRYAECDCVCDKRMPVCTCNKVSTAKIITKHPLIASDEELRTNPRAESAKLRIAERK